ncbi:MAG: glycoside hydrolase family 3 N-terminal domain-containing protein [Gemmatimonadales bacterium]
MPNALPDVAESVLPAIRWDPERGYEGERPAFERALAAGVGGFILFGGEREATRALTAELRAAAPHPLLIASDLERGAGQQVKGLTQLPPLMALAALGLDAVREAARITALESRDVGINWALAPVCDLDIEPANPIVQTRAFGADAYEVAEQAAAWIGACQSAGVLACAKHYPGHGRTATDSHAELPVVSAGRELERDLMPFRRAVLAGVAGVMTAHVAYPAWDPLGVPATCSRPLLTDLLRRDLFFTGLTVTDALIMEGALSGQSEAQGAARALRAGCDLLLYPKDLNAVVAALRAAAEPKDGIGAQLARAAWRRADAARRALGPQPLSHGDAHALRERGEAIALASLKLQRGELGSVRRAVTIEIVDDDAGGPYPLPPRTAFGDELTRLGIEQRPRGERVVLLFADVKGWKGRSGLSDTSARRLATLAAGRTPVIVFGHPRRISDVPGDGPVLCAWSGDEGMQRAAARRFAQA